MKKIILFLLMIIPFLFISASAEEVKYQNLITDETTIEEDFKLLNIDINDYYKPTKYNYQKWYVIGMSEAYNDMETYDIQTYFYLYNPCEYGTSNNYMSTVANLYLTYKLGEHGEEVKEYSVSKLEYNKEHLIYKVKGFSYSFTERAEIYITKVKHVNFYGEGITSDSSFKAVANHSKLNGLSVELSFNSTIILENYVVAEIEIHQDDNIINNWDSFWSGKDVRVLAYFYNFDFPDHIQYDDVLYAKFQYNYLTYYEELSILGTVEKRELKNSELVVSEYNQTSRKVRVNNTSQELTFPTFYLGNRIKDKQFGTLKITGDVTEETFNYDCSVFLDTTQLIKTNHEWIPGIGASINRKQEYTTLDQIEMLELHYLDEGIIYKCQVVDKPVDKDDILHGDATDQSWWDKIWGYMVKFGEMVLEACNLHGAPELFKGIVGCGLSFLCLVVGIVVSIVLLPYLIEFLILIITLPIRLVQKILSL